MSWKNSNFGFRGRLRIIFYDIGWSFGAPVFKGGAKSRTIQFIQVPTASSARGRRRRFLQMGVPTTIYVAKVKKKRTKVVSEGIEKVAKNNSKPKGRKREPKRAGDPKGNQNKAKGVKR